MNPTLRNSRVKCRLQLQCPSHVETCLWLKDAPRAWRLKLDRVLKSLGGFPLASDPAIYKWHKDGALVMILSTHVDDKKGGGDKATTAFVRAGLEKAFGALTVQEHNFIHCGIQHEQNEHGIKIHQQHYVKQ